MSEKHTKQQGGRVRGAMGGPMGGPMAGMMPGAKAKDFKGTMKKLLGYLGAHKWTIIFVWTLAIISTVFTIWGPRILGDVINELVEGFLNQVSGAGGINFFAIGKTLLWLCGLYVISAIFSYLQGFVMSGITKKVTFKMRNDINDKIHKLPLGYYDRTTHGEVLSRITNDVDTISQTLNQSITQIITSITTIIGITVMMFTISWQMTLVALGIIPVSFIAVMVIVKKSQKHFMEQQEYLGKVNGHVEEMLGSHVVVKAFNGEEESTKIFAEQNDVLYKSAWKSNFLSGLMMPITMFIGNLSYVAICILGGYFAVNGKIDIDRKSTRLNSSH